MKKLRAGEGLPKTLELIEQLKEVAVEVTTQYKEGYVDQRGNYVPPSPKEVGYLLSSLVQVAKFEKELEDTQRGAEVFTMVPWQLD